jgi:ketosteroid isomerase-like protein
MSSQEQGALSATLRFYEALDQLLLGKGIEAMKDEWWHDDRVATVHPFGHWAQGWSEVLACWQETAAIFALYRGHAERTDGIGGLHDIKVVEIGDAAVVRGVYRSRIYLPGGPMDLRVNCTEALERRDGVWKMIHHHVDQAPPEYQAAIASLVGQG